MHIDIVPNRGSRPAVLLRETYREGRKVRKRTLANLSKLPMEQVEAIRRILKGEQLLPVSELFEVSRSRLHGHVHAVRIAMKQLGFDRLSAARRTRERDLVVAMGAARILEPQSKLATTRWWGETTLPQLLGVEDAHEDELYAALDWLLQRQDRIERKLAKRPLDEDGVVLYDLSSSYFDGATCPLAARGHSRDRKKGTLQVNYGLLTDPQGRPVSITVFPGNTADSPTFMPQVELVRDRFGIERVIMVGDRGMITGTQVKQLREVDGVDWVAALRPEAIRKLVSGGAVQLELFDERNLFELVHPDFPDERLVACRNPHVAARRAHKRTALIEATKAELEKVRGMVGRGRLQEAGAIGVRVGRVINRYKVAKHFRLDIRDDGFDYELDQDNIDAEAALDGIYIIRTSVSQERMEAEQAVRTYKRLAKVERAFRSMKTVDLLVRPIHLRLEGRVCAHIFLCMLAYYVQWHMLEAWRPLLFSDEETQARDTRDPVVAATRSDSALDKVQTRRHADGSLVHSFRTLLQALSSIVRNTCRRPEAPPDEDSFGVDTTPNPTQARALQLLSSISM